MKTELTQHEQFQSRHIGPRGQDIEAMLATVGVTSIDELIEQTVPEQIRLKEPLKLSASLSEDEYLNALRAIASENKVLTSYLGQGYYNCITPSVIKRTIFENPGWYTQYTPYQPEISQGRLEALLNYQTMVTDLTAMEIANASLLDEGTSAAEAMVMVHGLHNKGANGSAAHKFFVSDKCFVQTIEVLKGRASGHGIDIVVGDLAKTKIDASYFGILLQYPAEDGSVLNYREFIAQSKQAGAFVVVATDLLSLALLTPPGEFGADVVVGNSQRFGVPIGFGGPHAGFFATKNEYVRSMPGRIIGVSIDSHNNPAYRMTLQTREQHIRREKATSNICTAQALLAILAGMFAVYHGPKGLRRMAARVHALAKLLESELLKLGYRQENVVYFDTLKVTVDKKDVQKKILSMAVDGGYNLRSIGTTQIGLSLDETTRLEDVQNLLTFFAKSKRKPGVLRNPTAKLESLDVKFPEPFERKSLYLQHPVFSTHHSELEMTRYIKSLENKDLSMTHSMISLGSCTMKLNAATELIPVSWPEFASLHPFAPGDQTKGYERVFKELESALCEITGFAGASLQPNSGAQGEFTGLMVIRQYHIDRKQSRRTVVLIPSSAHGTNPASAVMAGFQVIVVQCDEMGNIDVEDLRTKAEEYSDSLGALMVTYPSTHGVFEESIKEICEIIHKNGGLVYMDGANMNAQVGLTSPAEIGADVCHLNLHKTFAIPHGGGGPGVGPICVAKHLVPYLPRHPMLKRSGRKAIHPVASSPWGSASILLISYGYIRMLGSKGVTDATKFAILNANYLKSRLEKHYPILYQGKQGRVAHEFIVNMKQFKEEADIEVLDIAKRLMDYGFHAPTVSFPVHDTLMIEPTESEPKAELDRFADALIEIRNEMQEVIDGKSDKTDNVLKNAPHTVFHAMSDTWNHTYSRQKAMFPLPFVREHKFWVPVGRINSTYGDRNIVCTCPPIAAYSSAVKED